MKTMKICWDPTSFNAWLNRVKTSTRCGAAAEYASLLPSPLSLRLANRFFLLLQKIWRLEKYEMKRKGSEAAVWFFSPKFILVIRALKG